MIITSSLSSAPLSHLPQSYAPSISLPRILYDNVKQDCVSGGGLALHNYICSIPRDTGYMYAEQHARVSLSVRQHEVHCKWGLLTCLLPGTKGCSCYTQKLCVDSNLYMQQRVQVVIWAALTLIYICVCVCIVHCTHTYCRHSSACVCNSYAIAQAA